MRHIYDPDPDLVALARLPDGEVLAYILAGLATLMYLASSRGITVDQCSIEYKWAQPVRVLHKLAIRGLLPLALN